MTQLAHSGHSNRQAPVSQYECVRYHSLTESVPLTTPWIHEAWDGLHPVPAGSSPRPSSLSNTLTSFATAWPACVRSLGPVWSLTRSRRRNPRSRESGQVQELPSFQASQNLHGGPGCTRRSMRKTKDIAVHFLFAIARHDFGLASVFASPPVKRHLAHVVRHLIHFYHDF